MKSVSLGGLECVVTGGPDREGGGDGPAVVLLHGFGAPGEDLVSLHRVLDVPRTTRFVFPAAPLSLGMMGPVDSRAWWMIDMVRLERAMQTGELRDLTGDVPEGLAEARALVLAMLDEVDARLHPSHVVLGGFSQGAMLSTDVALHTSRPLAGLVVLSGTLLAEKEWIPRMPARRGLPVLQSHGTLDPLLPFGIAERLHDELARAGLDVTFLSFRGGHEIPPPVVERLGAFLREVFA